MTEEEGDHLNTDEYRRDGVIIEDAIDENDDQLAQYLNDELEESINTTTQSENDPQSSVVSDGEEDDGEDEDKKIIFAEGASHSENIVLNRMKTRVDKTLKVIKDVTRIIDSIYDELKGETTLISSSKNDSSKQKEGFVKSSRRKSSKTSTKAGNASGGNKKKLFDIHKKRALENHVQQITDTLKAVQKDIDHIHSQKFSLFEESERKYYIEPRFTQTGSGIGYGKHYSLNRTPVNASVFYTRPEAMEHTDPVSGNAGGTISSSSKATTSTASTTTTSTYSQPLPSYPSTQEMED
jgi:hypothetical protein